MTQSMWDGVALEDRIRSLIESYTALANQSEKWESEAEDDFQEGSYSGAGMVYDMVSADLKHALMT